MTYDTSWVPKGNVLIVYKKKNFYREDDYLAAIVESAVWINRATYYSTFLRWADEVEQRRYPSPEDLVGDRFGENCAKISHIVRKKNLFGKEKVVFENILHPDTITDEDIALAFDEVRENIALNTKREEDARIRNEEIRGQNRKYDESISRVVGSYPPKTLDL